MPAFLVAEAVAEVDEEVAEADAEIDEEVAEIGAVLVDKLPEEFVGAILDEEVDEVEDIVVAMVLVHKELTALGTVTPAVAQICFAYRVAAC